MDENLILEVGYNGCDISDIKTQIQVPVCDAAWLAGIIYDGLTKSGYAGRFVNIVGQQKYSVTLNSTSEEGGYVQGWVEERIKLLVPFTQDQS